MSNDQSYINALLNNDKTIITEIYDTYYPKIQIMIFRNGGEKEDAWEIFQEALVLILKKAKTPDFQLTSSFYSFLYGICKFKWSNEIKKKSRKNVTIEGRDTFSDENGIEEGMIEAEKMDLYRSKFSKLDEACKTILNLFFQGKKFKQIADELGLVSEGAAKKRKHLCQKKLIKMVRDDQRFNEI